MSNKWIGALSLLLCGQLMASELVIESWRIDDKALWEQKIIPAFEASHPGIQVKFNGVQNVDYMPTLWASLKEGKAGISSPAGRSTTRWPCSRRATWRN